MRNLAAQELDQVSGGVGPLIGGALGGLSYGVATLATPSKFSWGALAGSVTFGAVTSGYSALASSLQGGARIVAAVHGTSIGALSGAAASNIVTGNGNGNGVSTLHESEE